MTRKAVLPITNRVRDLRRYRGMTQQELGDAVGVSRASINYIENGESQPSLDLAFRLAGYFDKPIEDIFKVTAK